MAIPHEIIEKKYANVLFPIRKLLPAQILQISERKPRDTKIHRYLFSTKDIEQSILKDSTLTDDDRAQLFHLRKMIRSFFTLGYGSF